MGGIAEGSGRLQGYLKADYRTEKLKQRREMLSEEQVENSVVDTERGRRGDRNYLTAYIPMTPLTTYLRHLV